ncbi:hypothetical protein [Conexibacter sp. SYSU D00693]|uniref:hypothetical protein n=1 Tax=Conexibacter sp. SYSU D00693 TaxID=2812560 RepID=UPI00196A73DB|nr:hypothetical protein [Conexibacter sp. SYSU D00693]
MSATPVVPDTPAPAENLAREADGRLRAGLGALIGGLLVIGGAILNMVLSTDRPDVFVVEALRDVNGQDIGRPSLLDARARYFDDEALSYVGSALLTAIGWAGVAIGLLYLFRAARGRRAETPRWTSGLVVAGTVGSALSGLVYYAAVGAAASSYVDGDDRSAEAARDVFTNPFAAGGQIIGLMATLFLALAFVFIALNAMRAGLLTRFMGILGIIVGALLVFPFGLPLPIVQTFWLVSAGLLILGVLPGGRPPAWETGKAEPWPSQLEMREAREREAASGGGGGGQPARSEPRTEAPSPATSKKKRKRRG